MDLYMCWCFGELCISTICTCFVRGSALKYEKCVEVLSTELHVFERGVYNVYGNEIVCTCVSVCVCACVRVCVCVSLTV